ncbi:hypothetical protein PV343_06780 [Streptomyces sp. WI03-4A]|uniref:hypothetical protein n=1 Tax=Streptomyces TaxID=1883 RepID=UPI0029B58AD2|nr:hypothetical protein [Streptomyces sp. WI03-4A]MDX2591969.1 hypothetical protein [Streptomyces sp. WI03-4A]
MEARVDGSASEGDEMKNPASSAHVYGLLVQLRTSSGFDALMDAARPMLPSKGGFRWAETGGAIFTQGAW